MTRTFTSEEAADAFWAKVDASSADGCWPWLAGTYKTTGRGQVRWQGKGTVAYRVAWILTNGAIPEGAFVCHHCDNPICVRPDHLFIGSCADNNRDMRNKGRGRVPHRKGLAHHNARISDEDIRSARESFAAGLETSPEIATRLGVAQSSVFSWIQGKTRLDAGGPTSADREGRNVGRPMRTYSWIGGAA